MPNLSQLKRQRMLEFLNKIKAEHTDDESLIAINEIETTLTEKKYGLVWEEHQEQVDAEMQTKVPVFSEDVDREIASDEELPYNFLLEGDNLHSLKLLAKTHKGKIDVIYIDPPYNTGAKDWKYNNQFVDDNDTYRHSKWISWMYQRLIVAKDLLKDTGIIVVTIDDYEVAPLKLLLDDIFDNDNFLGMTVIRNNPSGRSTVRGFSINHEYALFYSASSSAYLGRLQHTDEQKSRYKEKDDNGYFEWENFRKNGTDSDRKDRPKQFYPIVINIETGKLRIPNVIWQDDTKEYVIEEYLNENERVILPHNNKGVEKVWKYGIERAKTIVDEILVKETKDGYELYRKKYLNIEGTLPHTWWDKPEYSARDNGTRTLTDIFGPHKVFDFPKAPEAVKDCLLSANLKRDGVVLDFFAGSGTTAQATLELNKQDGGTRKFILCTNNENGICEEVTYNRIKTVISGKRIDGTDYSEGIPANLKYYKTDYIDKTSPDPDYNIEGELLKHIAEMVQLEYAVKLDGTNYVLLMSDEQADNFIANDESLARCKAIYVSTAVLLTAEQQKKLSDNGIAVFVIPDYYFESELLEVGER